MTREPPRTVVRPPAAAPTPGDALPVLAGPLLGLAATAARAPRPDPTAIAAEARRLAEAFETGALRAGLDRGAVGSARDALLAVLDARARGNPALDARAWGMARSRALPGGGDLSATALARRVEATSGQRDLSRFLRNCLEAVQAARPAPAPTPRRAILAPLLLVAGLFAWAGWAEWRFRADLLATMPALAPDAGASPADTARALDAVAAAAEAVQARAADSPLGLVHVVGPLDPAAAAASRYSAAVDATLPRHLADAVAAALATEGGSLALYDTLRVQAILDRSSPWQPTYLAGWLADRGASVPDLGRLARHAAALNGPPSTIAAPDPELLLQARVLAADGDPADFAFLELRRSDTAAALPLWTPAGIPGLDTALVRRSGRPLADGVAGLFTAAGWQAAVGGAAAAAIDRAGSESARILGRPAGTATETALLDTLQRHTLDAWSGYLEDLRVRPFTDTSAALLTTGALARADSPLGTLFREVWRQAGGEDRSRSHPNQLRIAATFGPAIQYVEQGHLADISRLFAALNVSLSVRRSGADAGAGPLPAVQSPAALVAVLDQAPLLIVQIVEDILAQTAATRTGGDRPRAAVSWRQQLAAACRAAIDHSYPFGDGPDADLGAVGDLLGPDGRIARFVAAELAPLLQTDVTPWRWKPEARLSGFSPESAAFFQRAGAIGEALFPPGGVSLTLSALAQRGSATLSLGGTAAAVTTRDASRTLAWPGATPQDGLRIALSRDGKQDAAGWPGPWGLLHFLDGLRLRGRDDGRRFLLDVRLPSTRVYLELAFGARANPAAVLGLRDGFACPSDL